VTRGAAGGTATRHVALLLLGFPPSSGSGAYRGLAWANHLVALGWRVTVLTVTEDVFDHVTHARDDSLLPLVDPRVAVVRVPMRHQHLTGDVRQWGPLRGRFTAVHDDLWRLVQTRAFPERYAGWIPGLVRGLLSLHRRSPVDVVLASGNPWSAFAAAWVFGRVTGTPYVMDYRDAWTLDQFTGEPTAQEGDLAFRWERRLHRDAARVVVVNEGMRDFHASRYPEAADRVRVIPNGYDAELVGEVPFAPAPHDRPVRFGYVGTVTPVLPHEQAWAGWALARTGDLADATFDIYGRLGFFARSRAAIQALLPEPGTSGVQFRGSVPKHEIGRVYERLDVLVLIVPGGRYVTTGKVFENLVVGKPVVLVCDPASDAVTVSAGHPLVHAVRSLDPPEVARVLREAAAQARSMTPDDVEAARRFALRYERSRLVAAASRELEAVVAGG
jgi:glycosyltransferase involved in cell wall biosynthesis